MITKDVYVSAAKTCTSIEGLFKKRRRGKATRTRDRSEDRSTQPSIQEQHVRIEGIAIKKKAERCKCEGEGTCTTIKRKRTGRPKINRHSTTEQSTERTTISSMDHDVFTPHTKDGDLYLIEDEIGVTDYNLKNCFTQTSAVFFEARYDQDNAILLNDKKYFLIPEEELLQLSNVPKPNWYINIPKHSPDSNQLTESVTAEAARIQMEEVKELAGKIVGVIIKASEKVANRTIYGRGTSVDSISFNTGVPPKPSLIPDTLQPKHLTTHVSVQEQPHDSIKSALSHHLHASKDKYLRLSLPIGRESALDIPVPHESVGNHQSSSLDDSDGLIDVVDKEFTPLTPSHEMKYIRKTIIEERTSEDSDSQKFSSFVNLRRDSIGIPLIQRKGGLQKDSVLTEEGFLTKKLRAFSAKTSLESKKQPDQIELKEEDLSELSEEDHDELSGENHGEIREEDQGELSEECDDETYDWTKLDILEDMGVEEEAQEEKPGHSVLELFTSRNGRDVDTFSEEENEENDTEEDLGGNGVYQSVSEVLQELELINIERGSNEDGNESEQRGLSTLSVLSVSNVSSLEEPQFATRLESSTSILVATRVDSGQETLIEDEEESLIREKEESLIGEQEESFIQEKEESLIEEAEESLIEEAEESLIEEGEESLIENEEESLMEEREESLIEEGEESLIEEEEEFAEESDTNFVNSTTATYEDEESEGFYQNELDKPVVHKSSINVFNEMIRNSTKGYSNPAYEEASSLPDEGNIFEQYKADSATFNDDGSVEPVLLEEPAISKSVSSYVVSLQQESFYDSRRITLNTGDVSKENVAGDILNTRSDNEPVSGDQGSDLDSKSLRSSYNNEEKEKLSKNISYDYVSMENNGESEEGRKREKGFRSSYINQEKQKFSKNISDDYVSMENNRESEEVRRRSLVSFLKRKIESALNNKIPEKEQSND